MMNKTTTCLFALAAAMLLTGCESPLNKAARAGDTARMQQLLDKGADINLRTLAYGRTPLLYAVANNNTNEVEWLLSRGADVNKPDLIGWTPLILAAFCNNPACVKILLEHGADINLRTIAIQDQPSKTAMDFARERGYTEIVQLLEAASQKGKTSATQLSVPTTLPPPAGSAAPF